MIQVIYTKSGSKVRNARDFRTLQGALATARMLRALGWLVWIAQ